MSHRAPVPPSPELIERIKREIAAPGFLRDLTMWAERQVGRGLSIENRLEPNKATDLINAAIVATLDGVRRWDPEARTLRRHFEQTINSKLWHEYDRTRRRRHIPLDTTSVDDSQDEGAIDIEMSLRREDPRMRPDGLFAQREVRAKTVRALRECAAKDPEVLAFLDAYEVGIHREGEVTTRLGVTKQTFYNALRRLQTARDDIPAELWDNFRETLVRDGGAPISTVARHKGRLVEIAVDESAVNDSGDSFSALDTSSDGADSEAVDSDSRHDANCAA